MSRGPYLDLLASLHEARVRYAIAGGFAVVLHGVPRMTFDLDLVFDLAEDNLRRAVDVLQSEGYRPRLPVPLRDLTDEAKRRQWIDERNLIAFTLRHPERPMEEVDILLVVPLPWEETAASTVTRMLDDVPAVVVGRAVLRAMKLATGREKDRADAELLGDDDDE
ncbi:MAG: hypothetical protein KF850_34815 [Labilithrix sp.]|nr:hypothetical protein [Labilithrix sp.]MBX3217255.1 hypothetical protein [Labilithrix sp.]